MPLAESTTNPLDETVEIAMTTEALWYAGFVGSEPPKMRRLCRRPMDRQWTAAIDLAIAYAAGTAGYRSTGRITLTGEETWHWPQPDGEWWLIPHWVDRRCMAIVEAATRCELHRGHGCASSRAIVGRLRRWRETGHWRRVAMVVYPRHGKPSNYADLGARPARPARMRRKAI